MIEACARRQVAAAGHVGPTAIEPPAAPGRRTGTIMFKRLKMLFLPALLGAAILATAAPAGSEGPHLVRRARLHGIDGPVYYSIVDGGYRRAASTGAPHRPPEEKRLREVAGIR